jgi:hypothetical protein
MTQWNLECDRLLLDRAIVQWDKNFDPDFDLLSSKVYGVVYHSTLRSGVVHPIREAFYYSAGLLDHGGDAEKNRAIRVLKKVLQAQDTNPNSRTYGIWPWFWEEPLDKMSPPDWNWADFCGEALYLIIRRHWERLPDDMQIAVKGALIHATRSIKRRNVGPGYTNIAILGTFVTLATAEWLGDICYYSVTLSIQA